MFILYMLKPIFKIVNYKLDIIGFYLHINIYLHKPCLLFTQICSTKILPNEICNDIISYLPDNFELILRLDIPNTFPINNIYISFHELKNTFLFPDYDFMSEVEYIKSKIRKINSTYCMVENRSNIDFDYLRAHSVDYLKEQINNVYYSFNQIQCVH